MVTLFQPKTIARALETRRKAIRLSKKKLAELAEIDANTVARALAGGSALAVTFAAIEEAIAREEDRLRRHLVNGETEGAHV